MVDKKSTGYLSKKKKTESLNFRASPYLKNKISEFVDKMHEKYPRKQEYNTISSFLNYSLENMMEIFEKDIDISMLKKAPDKDITDFFEKISFQAVIPVFERMVVSDKYTNLDFRGAPLLFFKYLDFFQSQMKDDEKQDLTSVIEKFKQFMVKNNLTKELSLEIETVARKKYRKGKLDYIGYYPNLHYVLSKAMAGILGVMGAKLISFLHSPKDVYTRFDLLETDLLYTNEQFRNERKALLEENVKYLVNYERIINDDDQYLWIELAKNKNTYIKFNNEAEKEELFEEIKNDILIYGLKEDLQKTILNLFDHLHWIKIIDIDQLQFKINDPIKENKDEINKFIEKFELVKKMDIVELDGLYLLK